MTDQELDLVPTPKLIEAIKRRFQEVVFIGRIVRMDTEEQVISFWRGSPYTCMGMAQALGAVLAAKLMTETKEGDGEI